MEKSGRGIHGRFGFRVVTGILSKGDDCWWLFLGRKVTPGGDDDDDGSKWNKTYINTSSQIYMHFMYSNIYDHLESALRFNCRIWEEVAIDHSLFHPPESTRARISWPQLLMCFYSFQLCQNLFGHSASTYDKNQNKHGPYFHGFPTLEGERVLSCIWTIYTSYIDLYVVYLVVFCRRILWVRAERWIVARGPVFTTTRSIKGTRTLGQHDEVGCFCCHPLKENVQRGSSSEG